MTTAPATEPTRESARERLERALMPLAAVCLQLHRQAVDYVVDGTGEEVLERLGDLGDKPGAYLRPPFVADRPGFWGGAGWEQDLKRAGLRWGRRDEPEQAIYELRSELYRSDCLRVDQLLRLGRVLAAVERAFEPDEEPRAPLPVPRWFDSLLMDVARSAQPRPRSTRRGVPQIVDLVAERPGWGAGRLVALLAADGVDQAQMPQIVLLAAYADRLGWSEQLLWACDLPGIDAYLTEHADRIDSALTGQLTIAGRRNLLRRMEADPDLARGCWRLLATLVVDSSKRVRVHALTVLAAMKDNDQERVAVRALCAARASRAAELVEQLAQRSRTGLLDRAAGQSPRLRPLIDRALADGISAASASESAPAASAPPAPSALSALPAREASEPAAPESSVAAVTLPGSSAYAALIGPRSTALAMTAQARQDLTEAVQRVVRAPERGPELGNHVDPDTDPYLVHNLMVKAGMEPERAARQVDLLAFRDLSVRASWPWLVARPDKLRDLMERDPRDAFWERRGMEVLATAPCVPDPLLPIVGRAAVSRSTMLGPLARQALATHPRARELAEQALGVSATSVRAAAAAWVRFLADPASAPAITRALEAEEDPVARAELLAALRDCGGDTAAYLNRDELLKQAWAGLAGGSRGILSRAEVSSLPGLHWADGAPVEATIVRWWVVLAARINNPAGDGAVALYLSMLDPGDARLLADHVVRAWGAFDSHPASRGGSATDFKGLLAFAVGMEGDALADWARTHLAATRGRRFHHLAVVQALAAHGGSAPIQVLVALADHCAMPTVRAEAAAQLRNLASRRGLGVEELADRTVPTAGFGDDGLLRLSYGAREFLGRPDARGGITLRDRSGLRLDGLPEGGPEDDAAEVRSAHLRLGAARREVRAVFSVQKERLYEAMCTGRTWPLQDWRRYLVEHPLLGHLVARIIWCARPMGGGPVVLVRPRHDGVMLGVDGAVVELPRNATVSVAHRCFMTRQEAEAWASHLRVFEVEQVLDQLGAQRVEPEGAARTMSAFRGRVTTTRVLHEAARRRGYRRGTSVEATFVDSYLHEVSAAGLTVVISFTGTVPGSAEHPCALTSLSFCRGRRTVALSEVPAPLLAEAYADYAALGGLGRFEADWETLVRR